MVWIGVFMVLCKQGLKVECVAVVVFVLLWWVVFFMVLSALSIWVVLVHGRFAFLSSFVLQSLSCWPQFPLFSHVFGFPSDLALDF